MALTRSQAQMARLIMGLGAQRGVSPARQRELAAAAYAESGLNPASVNRSSGAAGLFQLLSSGYRQRAQQLGGLHDPRANTLAILNDYIRYWKQNPRAAPGAAARDVERSGMGAEFYSRPLAQIPGGGVGALPSPASLASPPAAAAPGASVNIGKLVRQQFARGQFSLDALTRLRRQRLQAAAPAPSPPAAGQRTGNLAAGVEAAASARADPVHGKVIGTPYAGTHTLGNWESDRAIDVAVPVGTPVYSPLGGVIGPQFGSLGAGGGSRFAGLRLHVASPEEEWYGAHLSRFAPGIKPGRRVRPGQLLGYSGSASGVAHLHEALRRGDPYSLVR